MSGQQGALGVFEDRTRASQWRLARVEMVNWGTFGGFHAVDIARQGFLLTGRSGTGKSSLIDAVAAVLVAPGKVRFNAAAAEGTRRYDRTLASYVRGAWRRQADGQTGEIKTDHLRVGATWSGVLLRYSRGSDGAVCDLVKLFHLPRGESKVSTLCLILDGPVSLRAFEEHMVRGIDVRKIKARWPGALRVTDQHSVFAAKFSAILGLDSDNALALLHKTQSAKSLESLDELFRSFMLDRPPTFEVAERACAQFADLKEAHGHVVDARRQLSHLQSLPALCSAYDAAKDEAARAEQALEWLGVYRDRRKAELGRREREAAASAVSAAGDRVRLAKGESASALAAWETARAVMAERGGEALARLQGQVDLVEQREAAVVERRTRLKALLERVGLAELGSGEEYAELLAALERERENDQTDIRRERMMELAQSAIGLREQRDRVLGEVRALQGTRSNMPVALLKARSLLAGQAGIPEQALAFAGELIEVKPEFAEWTGAIERVLMPLALTLLVQPTHQAALSRAADAHHLGARLIWEVMVPDQRLLRKPRATPSLIHAVNLRDGASGEYVAAILASAYDYALVANPEDLAGHEKAVTKAGQVKRSKSRHEKDDRFHVADASTYVLGFDNDAKIERLGKELKRLEAEQAKARALYDAAEKEQDLVKARAVLLTDLESMAWDDIDLASRRLELDKARLELDAFRASNVDLRAAERAEILAKERKDKADDAETQSVVDLRVAKGRLAEIDREVAQLKNGREVPLDIVPALDEAFEKSRGRRAVSFEAISDIATSAQGRLFRAVGAAMDRSAELDREMTRLMVEYKERWPRHAADLSPEPRDAPGFCKGWPS